MASQAARLALGGPLLGLAVGMLGSFILGRILDDAFSEITITIVLCYSAFMLAEATEVSVCVCACVHEKKEEA
jgi:NhaP-type Na+/H+ or K+/H+ antiporter